MVRVSRMPGDGRGSYIPAHDYRSVRETFNDGKNDRFVALNAGQYQDEVMSYLGRDQLPYFHALADRFTVFDHWFASYMGQTWPNRYYLHATTSDGRQDEPAAGTGRARSASGSAWPSAAAAPATTPPARCCGTRRPFPPACCRATARWCPARSRTSFADARSGNLPNFALIDPDFKVNDAYPKRSLALCEAFVASLVQRDGREPAVEPQPVAGHRSTSTAATTITCRRPRTVDLRPDFRQLGFRVPALAIGPTVRAGRGGLDAARARVGGRHPARPLRHRDA